MSSAPWYVWALAVAGVGLILLATARELWGAAKALGGKAGTALRASVLFASGYAAWIVVSALLGGFHVYRFEDGATKPWLALGFAVPLAGLLLLTRLPFSRQVLGDPGIVARLTRPHEVRLMGIVFLIAMALGELPPAFALPAGLGDIAIGLAARRVARELQRGNGVRPAIWFNLLGSADFAVAFAIGFLGGPGPAQILHLTPSTQQISMLPLVLVPTAGVPLLFVLHVVSLAKLRSRAAVTTIATRPAPAIG